MMMGFHILKESEIIYNELFDNIVGCITQDIAMKHQEGIEQFLSCADTFVQFYLTVRNDLEECI